MHLRRFTIENIRSIKSFSMEFEKDSGAGWHVILGANGAGKSSVVRALALLLMGEKEAYAARQPYETWISTDANEARISGLISMDPDFDTLAGGGQTPKRPISPAVTIKRSSEPTGPRAIVTHSGERVQRTIWGGSEGWFSASFGPFRRFTGGDRIYDRLFVSNRRLAPHLTALGEDIALTEALDWLISLHVRALQDTRNQQFSEAEELKNLILSFINNSQFLPHGAKISEITDTKVFAIDGNGAAVPVDQLSDGYRSALSFVLELIRQMFALFGFQKMSQSINLEKGFITASGVVAVDEIDAHLHPTWQRDIGRWLTKCFPNIQFLVTSHSPIVCRSVADERGEITGGVWKLPVPGSGEPAQRIVGPELDQLVFGDVLDAFDTELFGKNITRSQAGQRKIERLAALNAKALETKLNDAEAAERRRLRTVFHTLSTVPSNSRK